ncbi:MAG: hypothetical protein OXO53_12015, partial [Chloroflexota bacterium]|nr:hypothetical protein [Chloroflexota bacterium]
GLGVLHPRGGRGYTVAGVEWGGGAFLPRLLWPHAAWFDAVVVNETGRLEDAAREVMAVIERERQRVPPRVVRL